MSAKVLREITTSLWSCRCEHCGHKWESKGDEPPKYCAGCKRRHWSEEPGTFRRGRPKRQLTGQMIADQALKHFDATMTTDRAAAARAVEGLGRLSDKVRGRKK